MEKCNHIWIEKENKVVCTKCNKYSLKLIKVNDGLSYGIKANGIKYNVRSDRNRYFFPDEWDDFFKALPDDYKMIFDFLIQTGSRIDEALHTKPSHRITDRMLITLHTTKRKAIKKETQGKPRTLRLSDDFYKRLDKYIGKHNIQKEEYIFVKNNKINSMHQSVYQVMKRTLNKINIQDKYNLSLHNIRKTNGMWLKAMRVPAEEICLRLGHDYNTYIKHYGSPSIFTRSDLIKINKRLGDVE